MKAIIRSRSRIGLDVGSYSVKVVATQASVGGARYTCAERLHGSPHDEPEDSGPADAIARAIAQCFSDLGTSVRSVRGISMGVAGPDVIVKQISLPLLDENEVAPALRFEARKHLPFDPQTMIIDFQVVGRFPSERRLEVLLAAVARDHAERHLEPLKLLGAEPDILDAAPLALTNAVVHGTELATNATVLLDIGYASSHFMVYQRGQPFFARRFAFGGRTLTRAIASDTRVPFEEAEEWKLAIGGDRPGLRVSWDAPEMQAIQECLKRDLVGELHRTFAFYRTQAQLAEPERLWISGGSCRLPGLAARLSEMLGLPVLVFDPLEGATGANGGAPGGPQYAQAFGLALRTA